ncbi:MAG: hypothetical protein U1E87_02135 [Alphaproteobacteria bacterium]
MDKIMNMATGAISGTHALEFGLIALVLALIMGSLMQDIFFSAIGVIIQLFLPVVYGVVNGGGKIDGIGKTAGDIVSRLTAAPADEYGGWQSALVLYVAYLIVIGVLFLIKGVLFRR